MLYANRVVVVEAHKVELVVRNAEVILGLLYPSLSDSLIWAVCFESGPRESLVNGSHG